MKNSKMNSMICLLILVSLIPITCLAYGNDGEGKRLKGPPPEAFEVCEGKQAGDSVEFAGRRGETLTATCEERNDQLVAVPEGMREHKRQNRD
ncbi:MAG: hypothetical protein JRE56_10160 [Deltaproteobacteria bacterium]|jgi:hypothetical protein|nr:hypothetical protein [Deltaproteobacteria bacterium]MBW2510945.1 hypothetical protein [Deltaproteobacteria bacterium]